MCASAEMSAHISVLYKSVSNFSVKMLVQFAV